MKWKMPSVRNDNKDNNEKKAVITSQLVKQAQKEKS